MTTNHKYYLDLAFKIAEKNLGKTKLNPSVGAIVVKNNVIISSGITSTGGRPHAEHNALIKKKKIFWSGPLYNLRTLRTHWFNTTVCR